MAERERKTEDDYLAERWAARRERTDEQTEAAQKRKHARWRAWYNANRDYVREYKRS
jgi:hypothetical protein